MSFVSVKVYELTLHYTQHWDHNVVTAALELLQQIFRTPPPELLHMLITVGSIQNATVFRQDADSRARSGSILELIGKHQPQFPFFSFFFLFYWLVPLCASGCFKTLLIALNNLFLSTKTILAVSFSLLAFPVCLKLFFSINHYSAFCCYFFLFYSFPVVGSVSCHLQLGEGLPAVHSFSENKEVTCFSPLPNLNFLPAASLRHA